MRARELSDADLLALCRLLMRGWELLYSPVTRCWWLRRPSRHWLTKLHRTLPDAIRAATTLHETALATLKRQAERCADLRAAFGGQ